MTRNEQRTRPAKYKWVLAMLGRSQDYSKPLSKQLSRATLLVAVSSHTPPLNNVNTTGSRHPLHCIGPWDIYLFQRMFVSSRPLYEFDNRTVIHMPSGDSLTTRTSTQPGRSVVVDCRWNVISRMRFKLAAWPLNNEMQICKIAIC